MCSISKNCRLKSQFRLIESEELRNLFRTECEEILDRLEKGLLALERSPEDKKLLEEVFRQAHSLKGAAAGLGVNAVEAVAHQFEDVLDSARRGRKPLTSGQADRLYQALDVLSRLVLEAVTGKQSGVDLRAFLEHLRSPLEEPSKGLEETAEAVSPTVTEPTSVAPTDTNPASIRVESVRLDRALAEMGDLVVTTARLDLRRMQAQELRNLYDHWMREARWKDPATLAQGEVLQKFGRRLERLIQALSDDHSRLKQISDQLQLEIREMRLLPLGGLLQGFARMIRDLGQAEGKKVRLVIEGAETKADRRILDGLRSPLTHLLRNAVDHGLESPDERRRAGKPEEGMIVISALRQGPLLEVVVRDDGAGLDFEAIREGALLNRLRTEEQIAQASESELSALLFVPGFSTRKFVSTTSGRGTGLDAVRADVESLSGTVSIESSPGSGTLFRLRLPLTIATSQVLVCRLGERQFAVPLAYVERSTGYDPAHTFPMSGRSCMEVEGAPVQVNDLAALLDCRPTVQPRVCLVLRDQAERQGFLVEELVGVFEVVVKPFSESPLVSGVSILADGDLCLILQPGELFRLSRQRIGVLSPPTVAAKGSVLLVEDSASMRALTRQVLSEAGYFVTEAVDGEEGLALCQENSFEAVITDIEMPKLDGLELTRRLRGLAAYRKVPIVLVTSLDAPESRKAGLEAGANAYLSKQSAHEGTLLRILERFL